MEIGGLVSVLRQHQEGHELVLGTAGQGLDGPDPDAGRGPHLQVEGGALLPTRGGRRIEHVGEADQP